MIVTPERELTFRTFLKTRSETALPGMKVFRTRKLFASPQDFAARTQQTYTNTFLASYLMIWFGGFRDDPKKGCDDDPVTFISYGMQLYRDIKEEKTTGANSHDLLVADTLTLRKHFLEDRIIESGEKVESQPLVQIGEMFKVLPCEHIVGSIGDWLNFRLTIEVNS